VEQEDTEAEKIEVSPKKFLSGVFDTANFNSYSKRFEGK